MKPTKEEISLAKQIAEKHRKEIKKGDWYSCEERKDKVFLSITTKWANSIRTHIPFWTISDCLEFLREKGFTIIQACEHPMTNEWIVEVNPYFSNAVKIMGHKSFDVRGDTLLIACLKAVLAVLEEEK